MPVARMLKATILVPAERRDELVQRLYELGAVHVVNLPSAMEGELEELAVPCRSEVRELKLAISRCDFLIELLERFEERKGGLLGGLLQGRTHLTYEEFLRVEKEVDLEALYRELEDLDIQLRHVESRIAEIGRSVEELRLWEELRFPLGELRELRWVEVRLAVLGAGHYPAWEREMEEACPYSWWEELRRDGERLFMVVAVHREDLDFFRELAQRYELEEVHFPGVDSTPEEEAARLRKRLEEEATARERLVEGIREKLPLKPKLLALNDYLRNLLLKEEVQENFLRTDRVVALEGWVEESRGEEVLLALEELGDTLDVTLEPPGEEDLPPTLLVNRGGIKPAESLINLFGLPNPGETDPTPFVAPFFVLFFGMCIGDVGYGALIALGSWLALRKLDLSEAVRRFFRLMLYCGIASMVVGVFTRGWFGIEGEALPAVLKFPGTLDVLLNPIPMMLICAALGLIHISIGVAIEMYDNMRHNSVWMGFCEQGTTLLMWLGLAVMALGAGVKVKPVQTAGTWALAAGAAGVVFLSNISSKSILGKFFGGLYNLYGLFGATIGDVASYLRLYALGMATVAIGSVINRMAGMIFAIPVLGVVLMVAILAGGHIFNLLINLLGAFVHPLRLQYVEFFGKFYEDGGEPFRPFGLRTEKVVIDDLQGGKA
ncbi:V-type ATP synthase subunit I [Candidatus Solincola tengchongensis]|uniref:V-type ATP synthase subunit I n=1 Tax=Candidatus Solincola tengchongensis TaxID=2900693 RepID=UPI00257E3887|nr:V-type ATP synthase subunit I [Candidatus Solincola tengchongensis]